MQALFRSAGRGLAAACAAAVLALGACSKPGPEALLASGKQLAAKNDLQAAAIQYKAALQADPQLPEARLLLGQALLDAGDPASAIVELSKAVELKVPLDQAVPPLARAMVLTGDYRKLTSQYDTLVLADAAAMASLKCSLATAWGALGNKTRTEEAVATALRLAPGYGPALVLNARLLAGRRDFDGAIALADDALKKDPRLYDAWHLKGEILTWMKNDPVAGAAAFHHALAIEKAYVPSHAALFSIAARANDLAAAKAQAEALRAVLPQHPQMLFIDAQLALYSRDLPRARELSNALLKMAPDNTEILQLAAAIEGRSGSIVVAESHYAKALQLNPDLPMARRNLGALYLQLGLPVKSLEVLKPIIDERSTDAPAIALAGDASLKLGDAQAAQRYFLRAAQLDPKDPVLQTTAAVSRLSRGDVGAVFDELNQISNSGPAIAADMAMASARIKRGEYDEALRNVEVMERKQPDNLTVTELRGRIDYLKGDLAGARKAFGQVVAKDPRVFTATANLAVIDVLEKRPQDAQKRLETALAADSRNHLAAVALAELRQREGAPPDEVRGLLAQAIKNNPDEATPRLKLFEFYLRRKQPADALATAREAAAALPNDAAVLDALGRAQAINSDAQAAVSTFNQMATLDPKSTLPYLRLAELHRRRGELHKAEAALKRALEIDPSLEAAQNGLIDIAIAEKRTAALVDTAREMQKRVPDRPLGLTFEGAIQARARNFDAALASYRAALKMQPTTATIAIRLHQTLLAAGRQAEADQYATERLKAYPQDSAFEYHLVDIDLGHDRIAAAEARLRGMVERFPHNALVLNNLAWTLVALGKPGAVPYAERANFEQPSSPPILDTLAAALAADKQFERAMVEQRKAIALAPDDAGMRLNLVKIAIRSGDKPLARKELESLKGAAMSQTMRDESQKLLATL